MNNIKILAYCLTNDNAQNKRTGYDVSSSTLSIVTFLSSLKFSPICDVFKTKKLSK